MRSQKRTPWSPLRLNSQVFLFQVVKKPTFAVWVFSLLILIWFKPASKVLAVHSARHNSSHLCACPPVNIMEGLELFRMSPVCAFWVNLHASLPSAWLFLVLTLSLSSVPLRSLPHTSRPAPPSSSLYTVHHLKRWGCWALGGIKVIYEWASLPACWRGKPVAVSLWSSSPLFPPASLQGKLLCLSCLWSFTVPYWRHMLPLSDSQTAHILPCRGASCVGPLS